MNTRRSPSITRGSRLSSGRMSVFFFQAEDGIRDYKVTGVQTCALPILSTLIRSRAGRRKDCEYGCAIDIRAQSGERRAGTVAVMTHQVVVMTRNGCTPDRKSVV